MAKIILIEDEIEVRQFCSIALQKQNHIVVSVSDGAKILDLLRAHRPDLLILDVMLPGEDGYSLQLQISQQEDLKQIPVLIMTALKPAAKLFHSFEQVRGVLNKPFHINDLLEQVNLALQ